MPADPLIDFDANATTRVDPRVVEAMLPFLTENYGNPSGGYRFGKIAANAVRKAREQVARLLGCEPEEVLFTSGGTEANATAIHSALELNPGRKRLVTSPVEHHAVLKPFEALEARGYHVARLGVDDDGNLDTSDIDHIISDETALVSVMMANNETGVLFPVGELASKVRERGVFFHTDAVQAAGKIPLQVSETAISFMSISAHKIHGPKGVGALYIDRRVAFRPLFFGGGQEAGKRAGTENVPGIVGLGAAAELAAEALETERTEGAALRDFFERSVLERISGVLVNGGGAPRLPNTSNLAFDGIEAEGALIMLDRAGICASAGSACTAGSLAPSHVLTAMGFSRERARSSLRFSFSRFNTRAEVERVLGVLPGIVARLRGL
ncbi:MAG: cysteine desulfurase family protein [Chthoniobacteraceae bacterium]